MTLGMPSELLGWVAGQVDSSIASVEPLVPEASTRRFWRVNCEHGNSYMAMFAPPETERNDVFVRVARLFRRHNVPVPQVHAYDSECGYLLVEDFGPHEFLAVYKKDSPDYAVKLALSSLINIQSVKSSEIADYTTDRLFDELKIFEDWICNELLEVHAKPLKDAAGSLVNRIDSQPKVVIHRDYHSRNLILTPTGTLGIVDFQDSLVGPLAYDLASLLYDCYFEFTEELIETYLTHYQMLATEADVPTFDSVGSLREGVIDTAIQRQIKAVGIFVRLWFLQRKSSHLDYVIPVLARVQTLASRVGFHDLSSWLASDVIPELPNRLKSLTEP